MDPDACQLERALPLSLVTALERMHTEPQAEEIEPVLGCLSALEATLDPQVRFQDAVDRLGSTTGSDDVFQDVQQIICQCVQFLIIGDQLCDQGQSELGFVAELPMTVEPSSRVMGFLCFGEKTAGMQ